VSAASDPRWGVAAMRAGAGDCLQKPLDRESLVRSVSALLLAASALTPVAAAAAPAASLVPAPAADSRLLDENVLLMGRVSLLERGLGLFAERSTDEVCRRFAELLRLETGAQTLELWAGQADEGELAYTLVLGDAPRVAPAEVWKSERAPRDELLRTGRVVAEPVRGNPDALPSLLVPCARAGQLLGVARLTPGARGGFGARELEIAARLGELAALALENARERASLARSSFRDPRTSLPGREFLDEVGRTEVHKAHRFGRRLSLLCVDLDGFDAGRDSAAVPALVAAVGRTLRTTDVLASEDGRRFWVLVTDTDPLGGVVLKRRIAQRLRDVLRDARLVATPALGVANFPVDGESLEALAAAAERRVQEEHSSVVRALGIEPETPLSAIGARLLDRARWLPREFVAEAAELLIGDLACRPRDRGLLFLAPGPERPRFLAPLTALGDMETATEVFLATDGDTIPSGPAVTALSLPPNVSADTSWIVRFGEGPPYALIAGKPRADGARPIFHSNDPVLVEHMTFRLRAETGFGVRA
jgi:diguanylate cyclase (GGDEF)-like protein